MEILRWLCVDTRHLGGSLGPPAFSRNRGIQGGGIFLYTGKGDVWYTSSAHVSATIEPEAARQAGAMWQVDGGEWMESGKSAWSLVPGPHRISFKAVPGFVTPAEQQIDVQASAPPVVEKQYQKVTVAPQLALGGSATTQTLASNTLTFSGSASDADGSVMTVLYRVRGGSWQVATGTAPWTATAELKSGENLIEVCCLDNEGNYSEPLAFSVTSTADTPVSCSRFSVE